MSFSPTDPLYGARRRLARAKYHITDLDGKIEAFIKSKPYSYFTEPDPKAPNHSLHKIRFTTILPDACDDIAVDAIDNLRAALDKATYGIAVAAKCSSLRHVAFPFGRTEKNLRECGVGRCKDLPQQIVALLCGFKPYRGGNDLLWALNEICNGNKHTLLAPIGFAITGARLNYARNEGFASWPIKFKWDRDKNEMLVGRSGPDKKFKYNIQFSPCVAFGDVEVVGGKDAVGVLHDFTGEVERILLAIEAECRQLGFIA